MFRKELIKRIVTVMREKDIKKPVSMPRHVFHISDDEGNKKDFAVRKTEKNVVYTIEDVDAMLDAFIDVVKEALMDGDFISLKGFGTLELKLYKGHAMRHVGTGELVESEDRYLPKFTFGNDLRLCAKVYELKQSDATAEGQAAKESGD